MPTCVREAFLPLMHVTEKVMTTKWQAHTTRHCTVCLHLVRKIDTGREVSRSPEGCMEQDLFGFSQQTSWPKVIAALPEVQDSKNVALRFIGTHIIKHLHCNTVTHRRTQMHTHPLVHNIVKIMTDYFQYR